VFSLLAASAVAIRAMGTRPENVVFLALAVGAAGLAAYAFYRALWPLAAPEGARAPEMLGGRTKAALEREKALTLRAIKDLEFDRAMKKVSESDWAEMTGKLRARAIRIIRQLDQGHAAYHEVIERELHARRTAAGLAAASTGSAGQAPTSQAGRRCASCQVENDSDARFCKSCGTRMGETA
jgi:hypothetical protein